MLDKPAKPLKPEPVFVDESQEEQDRYQKLLDAFEHDQAVYEEQLSHVACLPRNRMELFQTLEDELNLTACSLSAYIQFKRQSLQLIFANLNHGE